jgi:hypothetical protein
MMDQQLFNNFGSYGNILYIGDDANVCLRIIEKFTRRILKIEKHYASLIDTDRIDRGAHHGLQRHIQYHFEGGVAIFKFKNEDQLPVIVRDECLVACQSVAFEYLFFTSVSSLNLS